MPLRLLHISDIHFHSFTTSGWDEDSDLRNEVVRDVRSMVAEGEIFDGIVVGGDIAFSASAAEYQVASDWIDLLRQAAGGLAAGQVRVVPGNHDISRLAIAQSAHARRFRADLAAAQVLAVDQVLREQVAVDPVAQGLLRPLEEYNKFAERFGCGTSAQKLAWEDDSMVVDGHAVRLVGINSVINSGPNDDLGVLVVGQQQCRVERDGASVRILMLHHPPRWLKDWTMVEGHMHRAHLILFGHEHAFEARQQVAMGTVEVSAGALAPERDEAGERDPYLPTYNVVTLSVTDSEVLNVKIRTHKWDIRTTRFERGTPQSFQVSIEPALGARDADGALAAQEESISDASPLVVLPVGEEGLVVDSDEAQRRAELRNVGVRFTQLSASSRWHIAFALGVDLTEDHALSASERNVAILRRVRERGLVNQLIEEMDR